MSHRLRELERRDLAVINQWRNNKELIDLLGAPYRFINSDVDESWFENYMNERHHTIRCAIVDENDAIVGLISVTGMDTINRNGELHIMIGNSENRGKGIGTFAVNEIVQHCFNNLNMHRIELVLLSSNERARHTYENCGFEVEGIKREACYKNGQYVDMTCMAIINRK